MDANNKALKNGNDLREDIDITFEDAAFGKSMEIEVHRHEECDHCHGTGGEPGSRVDTCPNCHGSGQEAVIQNTPFWTYAVRSHLLPAVMVRVKAL